ncbi:hypothetical protein PR048_025182 [Dryococelus australis]|uniref:DUF659 domain-containing protein n=1 Tax=Dryococelus australis TaxID=614101 RepID=A0ABQ9GQL3_9NEOP|nr:hypothetical protein PR048_025182 [Dryococelus australis]
MVPMAPEYRTFLQKYCGQQIMDESTLRKSIWICVTKMLCQVCGIVYAITTYGSQWTKLQIAPIMQQWLMNDGLKVLWPDGIQEEKVLVLCSDAASYMLKTATALHVFYPNIIHFTCLAHGHRYIAKEVRSSYPQVNKIVSYTKKVFLKAPYPVLHYRELYSAKCSIAP